MMDTAGIAPEAEGENVSPFWCTVCGGRCPLVKVVFAIQASFKVHATSPAVAMHQINALGGTITSIEVDR